MRSPSPAGRDRKRQRYPEDGSSRGGRGDYSRGGDKRSRGGEDRGDREDRPYTDRRDRERSDRRVRWVRHEAQQALRRCTHSSGHAAAAAMRCAWARTRDTL
jgi:hypothetical protein